MKSQFGVMSLFLMKSYFSRKKSEILLEFLLNRLSYVSLFLVLYLTLFVADIIFITLILPKTCVFTTSYQLFHVPGRK